MSNFSGGQDDWHVLGRTPAGDIVSDTREQWSARPRRPQRHDQLGERIAPAYRRFGAGMKSKRASPLHADGVGLARPDEYFGFIAHLFQEFGKWRRLLCQSK